MMIIIVVVIIESIAEMTYGMILFNGRFNGVVLAVSVCLSELWILSDAVSENYQFRYFLLSNTFIL